MDAAIETVQGTGPGTRHMLLPALHAAQARMGWISEGALNHICATLSVPPAEAYGVATFYHLFALAPQAPRVVHVCDDIACRVKGADGLCRSLESQVGPAGSGESGTWKRSPCLGYCEQAPVALLQQAGVSPQDVTLTHVTLPMVQDAVSSGTVPTATGIAAPQTVAPRDPSLRLLRRVGVADPASLDAYRAHGGYQALRRALAIGPEGILREVSESKLLGRGGAAFPTGRKWEAVARAPVHPHYLVCNADESEPGTFKDRVLMEEDPFALVEAMTIAGLAIGARQGYIYIRGEYPRATTRLQHAIAQATTRGWLGDNIGGEGVSFRLEVRRGAGAYICGEETSLFNSLEGFR
ncbi:MAG: NAD(P)H-dependent oxidoreductase subunit E, partial [Acidobacteria bacterium]|nr:NAD(P)H-dependent oxidoreductase subunit E [Acidobacteriota bacterium]